MTDPLSPKQLSALLAAHGLHPQKRLGQNFLIDRNILNRIVDATEAGPQDRVLEIGAGPGALTRALAERASFVTAIEIDKKLEPVLNDTLAGFPNVRLLLDDYLRLDPDRLMDEAFGETPGIVAANIPYYITTPILESLLERRRRVKRIVLLVQEEFAKRMAAKPDTPDYGAMTLFAQFHTRVEIAGKAPRTVFFPPPQVGSSILALTPYPEGAVPVKSEARLFQIIRAAFGKRRKTLLNALINPAEGFDFGLADRREAALALLQKAGISPERRGETLTLEEFAVIADCSEEQE